MRLALQGMSLVVSICTLWGEAIAQEQKIPNVAELTRMNARFAQVDLRADAIVDRLPKGEQQVLSRLIEASKLFDAILLRQVWAGNPSLLVDLASSKDTLAKLRLQAFLINRSPWSELDHHAPFLPGVPAFPPQANFYPAGTTKEEVDRWFKLLPDAERKRAMGFFTTVRRGTDGRFQTVPYSVEYAGELELAAAHLRQAATMTTDQKLRKFLAGRASAFLSNDYYESDVAWMELDGVIEPTIGPYEVYNDRWFNAKASFEAYITVRDEVETTRLARLSSELQGLENNLPIDPAMRNPKIGALSPIRVVHSIFSAGDGNRGVQAAAYNLPNDERIVQQMGSKRVLLKNVQEAKFKTVLLPIAKVALSPEDQKKVAFDAFFAHILMHELMHGLGPHNIKANGRQTTVREQLQDHYSAIEEAKADISGLYAIRQLLGKGIFDKSIGESLYITYLAGAFRTIRFGIKEAHGQGMALQLNYLMDQGAILVRKDGTFAVDEKKMPEAVKALTTELMTLQGKGDGKRAAELLSRLGVLRPDVEKVIAKLGQVPVDIAPRYPTAEKLLQLR